IVDVFLSTSFQGGRHKRRVDELQVIELEECQALGERLWPSSQAGKLARRRVQGAQGSQAMPG
ncbi:MAG TPA: hypothetical protein VED59_06080, partial [Acidimicrobiales bacterium]|nr:hypothetical protein [Acidimicrobiales bacterium]